MAARPDVALDADGFVATLDKFREINRCRGFQTSGSRTGWARRIGGIGLKVEGYNMRSTVQD